MNSIDAIIAMCVLFGGYGMLIAAVNNQKDNATSAEGTLAAKNAAMHCGAIIDSLYSNSAEEYSGRLDCEAGGGDVNSTVAGKTKSFEIITRAKKTKTLEVEINGHYKN